MESLHSLAVLANLLLEVANGGGVFLGLVLGLGNAGLHEGSRNVFYFKIKF